MHDLLVKTHAADTQKIAEIKRLVADHIDTHQLLRSFGTWRPQDGASPGGVTSRPEVLPRALHAAETLVADLRARVRRR